MAPSKLPSQIPGALPRRPALARLLWVSPSQFWPLPTLPLRRPGSAQLGDHAGFAQLYSLHKRRIYSLCLRMVGNVAEAEDLTQEAFLQLHRKIATFRGDSAFSTWLHRLAINVVLMQLRKKGLR